MLKFLIFFTLILFIQNYNLNKVEKDYLITINDLTTKTKDDIKKDFEDEITNLEKDTSWQVKTFLNNFSKSGFNIKEKVSLKILIDKNEYNHKRLIQNYITSISGFKRKKLADLITLFMDKIKYSDKQWSKSDLLVTKEKNIINTLSIFTKKIDKNYVTVYVITWNKMSYYKSLILINNSINEDNPFNNKYDYNLLTHSPEGYLEYSSSEPLIRVLVKYYSILSYYAIAQAIPAKFVIPFE